MDSAVVEIARSFSHPAAVDGGNRARSCGLSRRGFAGPDDDQSSVVGDWLCARFRAWDRCWNDADYRGDRASVYVFAETFFPVESGPRSGFRVLEPLLRPLRVLPHWHRRRVVHKPSELDTALGGDWLALS